jgi:hypothetical protein
MGIASHTGKVSDGSGSLLPLFFLLWTVAWILCVA